MRVVCLAVLLLVLGLPACGGSEPSALDSPTLVDTELPYLHGDARGASERTGAPAPGGIDPEGGSPVIDATPTVARSDDPLPTDVTEARGMAALGLDGSDIEATSMRCLAQHVGAFDDAALDVITDPIGMADPAATEAVAEAVTDAVIACDVAPTLAATYAAGAGNEPGIRHDETCLTKVLISDPAITYLLVTGTRVDAAVSPLTIVAPLMPCLDFGYLFETRFAASWNDAAHACLDQYFSTGSRAPGVANGTLDPAVVESGLDTCLDDAALADIGLG